MRQLRGVGVGDRLPRANQPSAHGTGKVSHTVYSPVGQGHQRHSEGCEGGLAPHCLLPTLRAEVPVAFRGGATSLTLCHKQHVKATAPNAGGRCLTMPRSVEAAPLNRHTLLPGRFGDVLFFVSNAKK